MRIEIPKLCVVALIGATGSGKTTFAKKYFNKTEILSSDYFRALVSDDENSIDATADAFDALFYIAEKRLSAGKSVVIDATNVQQSARAKIIELAHKHDCFPVAVVLDMPEKLCIERTLSRSDRNFGENVVKKHMNDLKRSLKYLKKEGFRFIYNIKTPEDAESCEIIRITSWTEKPEEHGPFDIIGDVHGCYKELCELLEIMGYSVDNESCMAEHPEGRKAVFLGDIVDRGPWVLNSLKMVMNMVEAGNALCIPGNHEIKLLRMLGGKNVNLNHGLEKTVKELESESDDFIEKVKLFLDSLISHYVLDDGRLVVSHAGMKEKYQGRSSKRVRAFALYGETTGETDEYGLPVRCDWAADYRGKPMVVYGHTPVPEVYHINRTFNIDTGCVFGGKLTALRYPEGELVEVNAREIYYEPVKPLIKEEAYTDILNINDILEKRYIETSLYRNIKIKEENAAAALEIMSRYAADPHWLIYLPPTMSPCETSGIPEFLEHPEEAFAYYRSRGVDKVVCEQKHMGSRAVMIICRDSDVAKRRFLIADGSSGIIYTRTGRHFFENDEIEKELLEKIRTSLDKSGFWEAFSTDWVCLDTELMPWSAKARKLLLQQYAPTGCAGINGLDQAVVALKQSLNVQRAPKEIDSSVSGKNTDIENILKNFELRRELLYKYKSAYGKYCWNVDSIEDYRIAPFHILASEGKTYSDKDHIWHMENIKKYMTGTDQVIISTNHILIDVKDDSSVLEGINWWGELTSSGGEGMVVKPLNFISRNRNELLQPAVKCRGREYLRIIYGPEYTLDENIKMLKKRSLAKKRNLALNEFALGMESLERFVGKMPLYKVHECVFGVLALESEPVDPRL